MSLLLAPIVQAFRLALEPVAPFTWFGLSVSTLDVAATIRLCVVLRQIKEGLEYEHVKKHGGKHLMESRSFVRSLATTLVVVYGGEAVISPMVGVPPSFLVSPTFPIIYTVTQGIIDYLPYLPMPFFEMELPLSFVDGMTRAFLLCNLIPPPITTNAFPNVSGSPWALLLSSFFVANGGFLFTNMFSLLNPTPLALQTPPEMQAYGWMTADLWCAPLITGLYAFLTHAQPFWADLHRSLFEFMGQSGGAVTEKGPALPEAVDPEIARAFCSIILMTLFTGRTVKNFKGDWVKRVLGRTEEEKEVSEKKKTQ